MVYKMIIGIYGKIGSGKTYILNKFINFHPEFKIINADDVSKKVLENQEIKSKLFEIDNSIIKDNKVDKKYLRKKLFTNKKIKQQVDSLLWPLISREIQKEISNNPSSNYIIEAALLFELNLTNLDLTVKVKSSLLKSIFRVLKRDKTNIRDILRIRRSQNKSIKRKKPDLVISNFYQLEFYIQKNRLL
ncbi:dephospho-CoA kinase [Mycoplasma capricolum subsp. capripneumoniae]|uniref:Dephospho-CoA kinase n=2 Tax=Mycoplasma capricolum TaxID=2095 RepID=A0A9N7BID6_MYCCC|nr:dephospho-CoA kinase [Mycoplasma capricolum subsp. capripneumoniae 87001]QIN42777.1 dephospho-CoA kinase [Mycoplasma capricolum subsp. capripneumoniae]QIN43468.1 dephospho-CoA kinase [Mycoplasma capricolum subsp. capripneumoniae]QIN44153.1 dephospho-CoA kinase [Mycoplasma capricolum subsp. capripneumoniae]QIN46207.1 dephospho-CoA kinase [Mycoplasma capricolum subsp. capripneumoniae]